MHSTHTALKDFPSIKAKLISPAFLNTPLSTFTLSFLMSFDLSYIPKICGIPSFFSADFTTYFLLSLRLISVFI